MDVTEWRDIPGYEGRYQASSSGKIRSLLSKKELSPCLLKGYEAVGVSSSVGGKSRLITVHRLVLMAFSGMPEPGMEARHLDGNCRNNRAGNLQWATHLDNMRDRFTHGTYLGRIVSPETAEKIAASKRGKPRDVATKLKISEKLRGHRQSDEVRARKSIAQKARWAKARAAQ